VKGSSREISFWAWPLRGETFQRKVIVQYQVISGRVWLTTVCQDQWRTTRMYCTWYFAMHRVMIVCTVLQSFFLVIRIHINWEIMTNDSTMTNDIQWLMTITVCCTVRGARFYSSDNHPVLVDYSTCTARRVRSTVQFLVNCSWDAKLSFVRWV
jgi:hypothetical protein